MHQPIRLDRDLSGPGCPWAGRTALALAALLVAHHDLPAQRRETPLSQVRVPHSYYWREMYVPQVTSGPSAFTWSPDGQEVIYSMQGSLWRQRLGTATATQLTSGDTYDYQPDWSPDGRSVVYSAYDGKSLALMLLHLPTGESRPLIDDGNVNLDARWSPDGSRIAFVSTAHNARWHVFVARVANARLDSIVRVTQDNNSSQLQRYYYSAWDHYLSPTWSPDGRELILVSNRNHIYGTGGLWRVEARAGAPMRELHYEETAWRAHPDWARDGKRVVYAGYHGGQWHQLWLARSEPSDAIQLTYGDFDALAPRWSPDMSKIGFISNESGNTALWTVTVPGGRRERIEARTRRYHEPSGRITVTVVDSATRRPLSVRLSVRGASGKFFAPDSRWRHSDEAVVRNQERFEYGYWHSTGADTLNVPPGRYVVEAWRGPEWRVARESIDVVAGRTAPVRLPIARLANLPASGWWGGDVHVHMNYGGIYRNTPARLARQARAEGLHVVENLTVNKEQRIPDIASWRPGLLYSSPDLLIGNGQEFHTSALWGHSAMLGLRDHYLLPDYAGYAGTAFASLFPTNAAMFDLAHEQGALTGYVHPFDGEPDLSVIQGGIPYELPVDAALGKVDYLEVMGYSDHRVTSGIWYRLLNCGFRIPAAAGTDAFPNFAQLRGPPGLVRVYAQSGPTLDHARWLQAVRAGRTFVTNAPIISFTLDGRGPGSDITVPFARRRMRARVTLQSPVAVEHLEIIGNGAVVARLRATRDTTITLTVDRPGWYLARAYSDTARLPVLDLYPFASTSPVYVSMGAVPRSCGADAEYFLKWIDLLSQRVRADTSWNTAAERDRALAAISRAHEEFIRRR